MNLKQNKIHILGAYGSKFSNMNPTCFLINDSICIDAGNILAPLGEKAKNIHHILLTHSHLDHILDIPFLIDNTLSLREFSLNLIGLEETLNDIKSYIMNWDIWPDFSAIKLLKKDEYAVNLKNINYSEIFEINGIRFQPVKVNHTVPTTGYIINEKIIISGDTTNSEEFINKINKIKTIEKVFIDVSFPSNMEEIAKVSKHHSVTSFKEEIKKIKRDIEIYVYHMKPPFVEQIIEEVNQISKDIKFLKEGDVFYF